MISKYNFVNEIWLALESEFTCESKTQLIHIIKSLLQGTRKHNLSINKYICKMKDYANILALRDHNISDNEAITYILDGLNFDYDPIVANITIKLESKYDKLTIQET